MIREKYTIRVGFLNLKRNRLSTPFRPIVDTLLDKFKQFDVQNLLGTPKDSGQKY